MPLSLLPIKTAYKTMGKMVCTFFIVGNSLAFVRQIARYLVFPNLCSGFTERANFDPQIGLLKMSNTILLQEFIFQK